MRIKTETINCDHEGCPCRWERKEGPWGAEELADGDGWVHQDGQDYCPQHAG
jgi:hypothetical protein